MARDRAFSKAEIRLFSIVNGTVGRGDYFKAYLLQGNFEQVDHNLFKKGNKELIQLQNNNGIWIYENKMLPEDRGSFTQFVANRMDLRKDITTKFDPVLYTLAAILVWKFHRDYQGEKKRIYSKVEKKLKRINEKNEQKQGKKR